MTIVGCGGVFTAEDVLAQIYAGASLIEFDNACLTFAGPNCVSEIHKNLLRLLKEKNFANISRAVGFDVNGQKVPPSVEEAADNATPVQPKEGTAALQNSETTPASTLSQPEQPAAQPTSQPTENPQEGVIGGTMPPPQIPVPPETPNQQ